MPRWSPSKKPGDRYEELMARLAAISQESQRRIHRHVDEVLREHPLGVRHAVGGESDGIRLAADGSLHAELRLQDVHGVTSTVILRSEPGGDVEEVRVVEAEGEAPRPPQTRDETEERLGTVSALAFEHLPAAAAHDFVALLRPALRLEHAVDGDPVVAQLGGLPTLPVNTWPVWEGHGPLSHVLSFDCQPVAATLPELGLPTSGRLAFFYFDGAYDNYASTVGTWDPSTRGGFRVMHLHPELSTRANITDAATPTPPGVRAFPPAALTAVRTVSWPAHEAPVAASVWAQSGLNGPRPGVPASAVERLYDALWELPGGGYDTHQIGGHACPQQNPVEMEVEELRRRLEGEPFDWTDPDVQSTASEWRLLLQVASDDHTAMMWGDVGQLYYLVRNPGRPEEALFTWQCG